MTPAPAGIPPEDLQRGPANFCSPALPVILFSPFHSMVFGKRIETKEKQFLAVDHSARASMKNAASCEN